MACREGMIQRAGRMGVYRSTEMGIAARLLIPHCPVTLVM